MLHPEEVGMVSEYVKYRAHHHACRENPPMDKGVAFLPIEIADQETQAHRLSNPARNIVLCKVSVRQSSSTVYDRFVVCQTLGFQYIKNIYTKMHNYVLHLA